MPEPLSQHIVIVQAGEGLCALPVEAVIETMRPAVARSLSGAPPWVSGVAVVRGAPTPVVDLAGLLGGAAETAAARWVVVRCGARTAALAVRRVVGVATLPGTSDRVPLLRGAADGAITSLRALDRELLVVLEASRLISPAVLRAVGVDP